MSQVADKLSQIDMNCIIIKFLGAEVYETFKTEKSTIYAAKGEIINKIRGVSGMPQGYNSMLVEHFKFHESWDLLMPVWRRFLKEIHFNLSNKKIREEYKMHKALISNGIYACCKETTYTQLIKAIDWANKIGFEELTA